MRLPTDLYEELIGRARAEPEREVCGLLGARGEVLSHYPIANTAAEPARRFSMDPGEQIHAMRRMREREERLFAIYHSHPHSPPRPSPTDLAEAAYPEALYLIVGLTPVPALRGYFLKGNEAQEVVLEIGAAGRNG